MCRTAQLADIWLLHLFHRLCANKYSYGVQFQHKIHTIVADRTCTLLIVCICCHWVLQCFKWTRYPVLTVETIQNLPCGYVKSLTYRIRGQPTARRRSVASRMIPVCLSCCHNMTNRDSNTTETGGVWRCSPVPKPSSFLRPSSTPLPPPPMRLSKTRELSELPTFTLASNLMGGHHTFLVLRSLLVRVFWKLDTQMKEECSKFSESLVSFCISSLYTLTVDIDFFLPPVPRGPSGLPEWCNKGQQGGDNPVFLLVHKIQVLLV